MQKVKKKGAAEAAPPALSAETGGSEVRYCYENNARIDRSLCAASASAEMPIC